MRRFASPARILTTHAYWNSFADLGADDRQRASAECIGGIKHVIAAAAPKFDLREILMPTVREGSGNHLNVAAVFSRAIIDRSGEQPKGLHRARIATT